MFVESRLNLKQRRTATVRLGTAPDGLPTLLSINRGTPPEHLLTGVAKVLGLERQPEEWTGELKEIADRVRNMVDARQFVSWTSPDGHDGEYYISWSDIKALCGSTLLQTLIHGHDTSTIVGAPNAPFSSPTDSESFADTRAFHMNESLEDQVMQHERFSSAKLGIDLVSERVAVAHVSRKEEHGATIKRSFLEESLTSFESARFTAVITSGSVVEGAFGNEYAEARRQLETQGAQWFATVDRAELLRKVCGLAKWLHNHHERGLVHADLKPDNILCVGGQLMPFDGLNIKSGEVSPGLSAQYAAPEQILGDKLTDKADQYALGVLLSRMVSGMLYGEEARFHIPVGSRRLEVFTMLKNPGIFIAPTTLTAPREAIQEIRDLVQRCLRYEPHERFESMEAVASTLESILERYEIMGHVECELNFGDLTVVDDLGLAWLIEDRHP